MNVKYQPTYVSYDPASIVYGLSMFLWLNTFDSDLIIERWRDSYSRPLLLNSSFQFPTWLHYWTLKSENSVLSITRI